MKAIELIDKLFTMNAELTKDAAAHIAHGASRKVEELNHDEFLHNLATWAAKKSGENVKDVLMSIRERYDADAHGCASVGRGAGGADSLPNAQVATLKDILSVAIEHGTSGAGGSRCSYT